MFVAESIEDVLKPKSQQSINKELDKVIDRFVDQVTIKDFLKSFNNTKHWQRGLTFNFSSMRKLKKGNDYIFLMDYDSLYNIVDDLASSFKFDEPLLSDIENAQNERDIPDSSKFPEFRDFWIQFLHTNRNLDASNVDYVIDRIMEKIAQEFNVEYSPRNDNNPVDY